MSANATEVEPLDTPGVLHLMWLLFMQPIKLHHMLRAWDLQNPSRRSLGRRAHEGDWHVRTLVGRMFVIMLLVGPMVTIATQSMFFLVSIPISWEYVASSLADTLVLQMAIGVVAGVAGAVLLGVSPGTTQGVAIGAAGSVAASVVAIGVVAGATGADSLEVNFMVSMGLAAGLVIGTVIGVALGVARGTALSAVRGLALGVTLGVVISTVRFVVLGEVSAVAYGIPFSVAVALFVTRLPSFLIEAAITRSIAMFASSPTLARWLPYRHHDLIHFPLPGLERILIDLGTNRPALARQFIDEAATTVAQGKPAQRALHELQARELEQAARNDAWSQIVTLKGPFFPSPADVDHGDPLRRFVDAATDVQAAQTGGTQHRRREQLEQAKLTLASSRLSYASRIPGSAREQRLNLVAEQWIKVVDTKLSALATEAGKDPEIPNIYVVGPVFDPQKPGDMALFRKRRDLVDIIDHDLDTARHGVLFLSGQRRMGKSSLLRMLPTHLGTVTTVSSHDFQQLYDSGFADAPHCWLVQQLAESLGKVPGLTMPPPEAVTQAWSTAVEWLERVDTCLAQANRRVLIAIDEVERLQEEVNDGRANLDFLYFVRKAGDRLQRIRLLLVSAHPLTSPRLGPKWSDRLISALPRHLGPLPFDDAKELLCKPVPAFPDTIFDDTTAAAVLTQTGGHPFLIQATGRELVDLLNRDTPRRQAATTDDVTRALAATVNVVRGVFDQIWTALDDPERVLLRALAHEQAIDVNTPAFRSLREQSFVLIREDGTPGFAFPMLARWIRDYQS